MDSHSSYNERVHTNKQTSKQRSRKIQIIFTKQVKRFILQKKKREKKKPQLFCFASLLRIYTFFLTFDTLCSFPQIVKPETDRSGGAWQLCLVLNSNKP